MLKILSVECIFEVYDKVHTHIYVADMEISISIIRFYISLEPEVVIQSCSR